MKDHLREETFLKSCMFTGYIAMTKKPRPVAPPLPGSAPGPEEKWELPRFLTDLLQAVLKHPLAVANPTVHFYGYTHCMDPSRFMCIDRWMPWYYPPCE